MSGIVLAEADLPPGDRDGEAPSEEAGAQDAGSHDAARQRRRVAAVALLAYLLLAAVMFRKGLWSPTSRNIGNDFDTRLNMWSLAWTPWALAHGLNPLFTEFINHPDGVNLMWNSPMPFQGLLLWPVTATAGPVASYNLLITLNVAFSAWCGFLALRVFVSKPWAAFAGGLLYGFSPYMVAQSLDHPSLTAAYFPPLLLLLLRQILVRQERPVWQSGGLLGIWAVAQIFTAQEMFAAQALVALIGLIVLVALNFRGVAPRVRHAVTALAVAAAVFLAFMAWPLHLQFFGAQRITGGSVQPPNVFVTDAANFVVPTQVQSLSPDWTAEMNVRWTGNLSESVAYLGVPLVLVLGYAVWRLRRRPDVRFAALLGGAVLILSFGPRLHLNGEDFGFPMPWSAIEKLPLLGHILPTRLMLFAFLLISLVVAVFLDQLSRARTRSGMAVRAAAIVAVAVTLLPDVGYPSVPMDIPSFFRDGVAEVIPEDSVALVAPFQQLYPADPMVWQAEAGFRFRMPQGYFFAPDHRGKPRYGTDFNGLTLTMTQIQFGAPLPDITAEARVGYYSDLSARQVQTVIVGPMSRQDEMVRFFTALLGPPLERYGDVHVWPRVHRLTR